jgi:trehalose 6-phosphate synthase/phosphatase
MAEPKLIVVSVRLPVRLTRDADAWQVEPSPGGLATALRAVAQRRSFTWVGWPGESVSSQYQDSATKALAPYGKPVFIGESEFHGFYEHFSNRLIWPLFHNISGRLNFDRGAWYRYKVANERFADAVRSIAEPGDTIWVHDYQLALVPQMLRKSRLDCAIGFFLHIPFPSPETYRTLPARAEILRGMLGADMIGFHTYEFAQHFRNACLRVLGLESEQETIALPSHLAHLGVHPIGVDPDEISDFSNLPEVKDEYENIKARFLAKKIILGVDRLDYTKGIPEKLLAYEEFLRKNPHWRTRTVLIQVAAPTRTEVREYKELKSEVDELVGRINGRFGTFDHTPIVYINQTIPRARLSALYRAADVAFITPLRDGMNLVALEYVAARGDDPGTLVLSEFAGAASCLAGARLVNPHNISLMADVLADAMHESESTQDSFGQMRDFVRVNTSLAWADRFLRRLAVLYERQRTGVRRFDASRCSLPQASPGAEPLFILDYAGTLRPHVPAVSETEPDEQLCQLLEQLATRAHIYVMSGRSAGVMDSWLGDLSIGLVCEDGVAVKDPGGSWPEMPEVDAAVLNDLVRPILMDYLEHTPGSKIERRRASLVWNYRAADPNLGVLRAKELYAQLEEMLRGLPYAVLRGSRTIEARPSMLTKSNVVSDLLERYADAGFVFCAGNDPTDEGMFEVVLRSGRPEVFTCFVGGKDTIGQYFVESPADLIAELESLVSLWAKMPTVRVPVESGLEIVDSGLTTVE